MAPKLASLRTIQSALYAISEPLERAIEAAKYEDAPTEDIVALQILLDARLGRGECHLCEQGHDRNVERLPASLYGEGLCEAHQEQYEAVVALLWLVEELHEQTRFTMKCSQCRWLRKENGLCAIKRNATLVYPCEHWQLWTLHPSVRKRRHNNPKRRLVLWKEKNNGI